MQKNPYSDLFLFLDWLFCVNVSFQTAHWRRKRVLKRHICLFAFPLKALKPQAKAWPRYTVKHVSRHSNTLLTILRCTPPPQILKYHNPILAPHIMLHSSILTALQTKTKTRCTNIWRKIGFADVLCTRIQMSGMLWFQPKCNTLKRKIAFKSQH